MSKAHRGKGILDQPKKGRGTCPICKRSGVKLLYEVSANDKKLAICKQCNTSINRGKKQEELAAATA
ncbi:hypothetical protein WKV44_09835 [Spirochaetia bacterium 38H-sp]|uniref:Uncharacterized protein n=1 Tax=Rarispira pelagica TaxID=3141764 RepID=A0ABU9UE75_9SPIR